MPFFGGLSPGFERSGGDVPLLQRIVEALNQARGTAYDTSISSNVYIENLALARALWGGWYDNERFGNQWNPSKVTSLLTRWESIFGVAPTYGQDFVSRRVVLSDRFMRFGKLNNQQLMLDELTKFVPPLSFSISYVDLAHANIHWPGNSSDTPSAPWSSSIANILILVTPPSYMTDSEFYQKVQLINQIMDPIAPAWVTWTWYRVDAVHGTIGFWLDSAHNLDNDAFDV